MVSDPKDPKSIAGRSRTKRMEWFIAACLKSGLSNARILDFGGTRLYWTMYSGMLPPGLVSRVDIVNLPEVIGELDGKVESDSGIQFRYFGTNLLEESACGTGTDAIRRGEYDIFHSISVIEHVGDLAMQHRVAEVARTLGHRYWIQTPAREFPLEAHFYLPFFAYWPLPMRAFMNWKFRLGVKPRHRNWREAVEFCHQLRLLNRSETSKLFPDGRIVTERLYGLPKCYIATNMP